MPEETVQETTETTVQETTETFDESRARALIDKLRPFEKHAKALEREKAELQAKLKEHEDAKLSETEKLQSKMSDLERSRTELERDLQEARVERAIERKAGKLGILDPEDAVRLMNLSALEYDEDGLPKGNSVEKALKALIERKPYLAGQVGSGSADGGPRGGSTDSRSMSDRIREAAGIQ